MSDIETNIPKWLDDEFLKNSIKKSKLLKNDAKIDIKNVVLSFVVPKGENYMSILYRATVKYQLETGPILEDTMIVKVCHDMEPLKNCSILMMEREIDMYENLVPQLENIYEQKGLKTQFVCRSFHSIGEPKVLVMEDLKPLGFVVGDRVAGFDLEHCKAVYSKIAQFHAAGMCYFHSQSDSAKSKYAKSGFDFVFGNSLLRLSSPIVRIDGNIEELKKYDNRYIKAIDFFTKYKELLDTNGFPRTPYIPESKFNSINHTDFWVNNMMFKYDEDRKISDLFLVDLQACFYTSVAFDFLFFLFSSPTLEVRKNNYGDLKKHYFDSLVRNLKQLDYKGDIPTMQEFEEELKRNTLTVMFCLLVMLPIVVQQLDKEMTSRDKSDVFSGEDIAAMAIKSNEDRNYLIKVVASVDILQDNGFLDKPPELLC